VAGLTATTLERYAKDIALLPLRSEGRSELEEGTKFFLTATALESLSDRAQTVLTGGQPLSSIVSPLSRTFTTLREYGVTPTTYREHVATSDRLNIQADAFRRYEELIHEHDYFDTADLFKRAADLARRDRDILSATVPAIVGDVSVSSVERSFVEVLKSGSATDPGLYLVDIAAESEGGSEPPARSATAQFSEMPLPARNRASPSPLGKIALGSGDSLSAKKASDYRFWTATGTRREVQAVFDDILEQNYALDTVEIAYTSPDPYLPLFDTLAERYDIPVTLSGGRAIEATRPGQALLGFFEWIANECPIPELIGLLRAGLLHLEKPVESEAANGTLNARQAATLLAEKRYPEDSREYAKTFEAWAQQLASEARDIESSLKDPRKESPAHHLIEKKAQVEAVAEVVDDLLTYAQMKGRTAVRPIDLAEGAERFLEVYGPTPAPSGPEDERTADEAARNRLLERLQAISHRDDASPLPPPRLANRMKTWMGLSPYVRAERPRSGRAHVVPLENAGYTDRTHLYVVGLDASSTSAAVPHDPLLRDHEREALTTESRSLPLRSNQADAAAWRTRRALARHEGPATLSASTYDLAEGEDLFESPLFLQIKESAQEARGIEENTDDPQVTHHALASNPGTMLSDLDRWTTRIPPTKDLLDDALEDRFPWIQAGLEAEEARGSGTYTTHDGLLTARSYPGLDPLNGNRPVSAGQLETYAQAPYAYFLRYVLDVTPLDEPALDDVAWLDALARGSLLHDTFRRFMSDLGRQPKLTDEGRLRQIFDDVLDEKRKELPPPSEVVFASVRRELWNDALLFLRIEASRSDNSRPHKFELGFGYPPHRRREEDYQGAPLLELGDHAFKLRGRIDRIDQSADGAVEIWDYKTGSSRDYDETDLLSNFHLQWALYAYAFEALSDSTVASAGYFFTSTDEMGKRISAVPNNHRRDLAKILADISQATQAGAFPVTDADALRYDYDRLFHTYSERRKQLNAKSWPKDRPPPPSL